MENKKEMVQKPGKILDQKKEKAPGNDKFKTAGKKRSREPKQSGKSGFLLFSIKNKIAVCFLVPILFMIVIGISAYQRAAQGMSANFQDSTVQTIAMAIEYIDMSCTFIESEGMKYAFDTDLNEYFLGVYENDPIGRLSVTTRIRTDITSSQTINPFISDIHIVTKSGIAMLSTRSSVLTNKTSDGILEEYQESVSTGAHTIEEWIDSHPLLDETFGLTESDYIMAFELMSRYNNACIVIDIKPSAIEDFISGLEQTLLQADGKYNVNMSLQGRTMDYNAPSALTQNNTTAPKAVYDPRIVGNDMGLWVMGRSWLAFVDEAAEELGEYAAHLPGRPSNIETALSEALYLTAVERNADVVTMTSYAPLLAKEGHTQWSPDLIYFNNSEVKPTVGYYTQQLFGQNAGNHYIPSTVILDNERDAVQKRIGMSVVKNDTSGDYIVKLVNLLPVEVKTKINMEDISLLRPIATKTVLKGAPTDKEAKPLTETFDVNGKNIDYTMPAYSFSVIRIKETSNPSN